jgi:hypothetical protein
MTEEAPGTIRAKREAPSPVIPRAAGPRDPFQSPRRRRKGSLASLGMTVEAPGTIRAKRDAPSPVIPRAAGPRDPFQSPRRRRKGSLASLGMTVEAPIRAKRDAPSPVIPRAAGLRDPFHVCGIASVYFPQIHAVENSGPDARASGGRGAQPARSRAGAALLDTDSRRATYGSRGGASARAHRVGSRRRSAAPDSHRSNGPSDP